MVETLEDIISDEITFLKANIASLLELQKKQNESFNGSPEQVEAAVNLSRELRLCYATLKKNLEPPSPEGEAEPKPRRKKPAEEQP